MSDKSLFARKLQEIDYELITGWWNWFGFPTPAREFLPENGLGGLMIEDQNKKSICAGFVYLTNSKVCWIEFIVSNPEIKDKEIRKIALTSLISQLGEEAKKAGSLYAFTSCKHPSLINHYLESGYVIGSNNATELIKRL